MKPRIAIKNDLFPAASRAPKIDNPGDPLVKISGVVDFAALASEVDRFAPRVVSAKGGRPPFQNETMVRILVLKRLHNLSHPDRIPNTGPASELRESTACRSKMDHFSRCPSVLNSFTSHFREKMPSAQHYLRFRETS
jgi:hypothetical protein